MKTLFILFLLFSSQTFAADVALGLKQLVSYQDDYQIQNIDYARIQVSAYSSKGSFRKKSCYKKFERNFPYAPQTTSFNISQNLVVTTYENELIIEKVNETSSLIRKQLKKFLPKGCKVHTSAILLVEGQLYDGQKFKSNLILYINKKNKMSLAIGAVKYELPRDEMIYVDVIPTVLYGRNWDSIWNDLDPQVSEQQRNF